jgi:hypothetical protein
MTNAFVFIGNVSNHLKLREIEKCCNDLRVSRRYRFATFCNRGSSFKPATPECLADLPEGSTLHAAFVVAPDGERVLARANPFPGGPSRYGPGRTLVMRMRACLAPTVWLPPHDHGPDTLITVEDVAWFIAHLGIPHWFRLVIPPGLSDDALVRFNQAVSIDCQALIMVSRQPWLPPYQGDFPDPNIAALREWRCTVRFPSLEF